MLKRFGQLFALGLWMGSTVFGGVTAAYPVIRAKAGEYGWLSAEEVDGLYAVAIFAPGPSFLNLWGAVAARVAGLPGALAAQAGLMLPSVLLVAALPLLARIDWVGARTDGALQGTVWATAGLLLATGVEGLRRLNPPPLRWAAAGLLALLLLGLHPLLLMGLSVSVGVVWALRRKEA